MTCLSAFCHSGNSISSRKQFSIRYTCRQPVQSEARYHPASLFRSKSTKQKQAQQYTYSFFYFFQIFPPSIKKLLSVRFIKYYIPNRKQMQSIFNYAILFSICLRSNSLSITLLHRIVYTAPNTLAPIRSATAAGMPNSPAAMDNAPKVLNAVCQAYPAE